MGTRSFPRKGRVPHISLVVREMWDSTALSLWLSIHPTDLAPNAPQVVCHSAAASKVVACTWAQFVTVGRIPIMSTCKRFLFTMVVLAAAGRVSLHKAEFDVLKPSTWSHAPVPVAAALPWYDRQPANMQGRWLEAFRAKGEFRPALFLPVQLKNPKDLGVGKLLVASRSLGDPDFARTVILLVRYDEKGALGLILNRRTDVPLSRVLDLEAAKNRSDPVYLGGPVGPSAVFALLKSSAKMEKAENIFGGVYLISDKALFEQTISTRPDPGVFHVYLGYAGWTQDQLRTEAQLGAWFVLPADAATVFNSDPDSLWLQMIQKTELQLAKAGPFAGTPHPVTLFRLGDEDD
jgi:putative AlgH/UPF0301 family transcriptional regulator